MHGRITVQIYIFVFNAGSVMAKVTNFDLFLNRFACDGMMAALHLANMAILVSVLYGILTACF